MVRDIERIENDLITLDHRVAAIAKTLHETYGSYLTVLGQAVRQQLTTAAYQICTQGYPEQFLALSYAQRQQLQQTLQATAKQGQTYLLELLTQREDSPTSAQAEPTEDGELEVPSSQVEPSSSVDEAASGSIADHPPPPVTPPASNQTESEPESPQTILRMLRSRQSPPTALLQWHDTLEHSITDLLRTVSRQVNHLLQDSGIVPKYFPEPMLEAAAKSEAFEAIAGPPNLLSLTVEAIEVPPSSANDSSADKKPKSTGNPAISSMKIMAIHMRLSEIEFVDSSVMSWRTRLRETIVQLKALEQDYYKVQRELAFAKAEAAWRSSWVTE